ncbi:hypothetical protein [Streptomyces sp. NPDC048266]|uniref:hypothetical protein n=1 Tax=Streptomyces sp. NPDC048266 TaxID=3155787 RepID=UPI0033F86C72
MNPPQPQQQPSRQRRARTNRKGRGHRTALDHFVRGLSYGTGLTVASLLGYWLQQML